MSTLPACSYCGLRPRYLVDGKWSTIDKVVTTRVPTNRFSVRPQHARWCPSDGNRFRILLRHSR